jgi:hypothetical protein
MSRSGAQVIGRRARHQLAGLLAIAACLPATATAVNGIVSSSEFGFEQVAVGQADRLAVAVWRGEIRGESILAAEHRTGAATWTRPAVLGRGAGYPFELDLATNRRGDAVAVWARVDTARGTVRVEAARRPRGGGWSTPTVLAEFAHAGVNLPSMSPVQTADVEVRPDGGALVVYELTDGMVVSRSLAPGREAWDAPQTIRPAAPGVLGEVPDVSLTLRTDGRAVAVWQQGAGPTNNRSIGVAERIGGTWSAPATLPGSEGGFYPAVATTADGETIAAWTTIGLNNRVATRSGIGSWSAPSRVGAGAAPRLHVGAGVTAITWPSGPGVALRAVGSATWRTTRAPVTPQAATLTRDGSLIVAGVTPGAVAAWSRLRAGDTRWGALRIESSQRDTFNPRVVGIAPAPRGPLATLLWTASVQPGRLGLPRGGAALQYAELSPTSGTRSGATPRLRLPRRPVTTPANAVVSLSPTFVRYTGPTRVQVQVRRGDSWRRVATLTADNEQPLLLRLTRPEVTRVRLAYGPRFRLATNAVRVRVLPTRLRRVVAGWWPKDVSAVGRDLWVLSGTRATRSRPWRAELRLLDAGSGRLRRGPVRIGVNPYGYELVNTGARVLLRSFSGTLRVLDPRTPGLIGPPATLTPGTCDAAACSPVRLTFGDVSEPVTRTLRDLAGPVIGPDGSVWGIVADPTAPDDARLVQGRTGAPPADRGSVGPWAGGPHDRETGDLLAIDGGVWVRNAQSRVLWFGATGPGIPKGRFGVLAGQGRCAWGLATAAGSKGRVVRIGRAEAPNGAGVSLGPAYLSDPVDGGTAPPVFTAGSGAAWVVAFMEQTLIRVPIQRC